MNLSNLYSKIIIKHNLTTLCFILALIFASITQLHKFHFDASSDTLVLEGNETLKYYRSIKEKYGSDEFVIITYTPLKNNLFTEDSLQNFSKLHHELEEETAIKNVISIINTPLLQSPKLKLTDIDNGALVTIEKENYSDLQDVENELRSSPIFSDTLLSKNSNTAALLVWFQNNNNDSNIKLLRSIISNYETNAKIFMGGIPMITADSIAYIKNDVLVFGVASIVMIALLLFFAFFEIKWVIIPLLNSALIALVTTSFFAFIGWPVTVVSANFISLLLIISLSLSVHYIVHFQELSAKKDFKDYHDLILKTAKEKYKPCLYTAITTIIAFFSLIISDIKPVITFGFMMSAGIIIAFIVTFLFIPTILSFLKFKETKPHLNIQKHIANYICHLLTHRKKPLITIFILSIALCSIGMSFLSVENRFIDYYKKETPIYQGMELIDRELGGTTPFDVIIDAPKEFLEDEYSTGKDYWFNSFLIDEVNSIHQYLESLPETGKVLSLASSLNTLKTLNNNEIDSFFLAIVRQKTSKEIKETLFNPYISADGNQIRFSLRVHESDKNLKRQELINKIKNDLTQQYNISSENIKITGMLVLYNDLLQSLFKSQILTLGLVFLLILTVLTILFRNIKIAILALIPNIITATTVLGLMGLLNIPLDIMTITIAAIAVGISVDNTIHYIHRFLQEKEITNDNWQAIKNSHHTIGRALYLTTITITIGFSVLALSNFVPTIYFGLLTGFAMLIALIADLLILPILLLFWNIKTR